MKLASIKTSVTSKIGRQTLIAQKHSPEVLFGLGIVAMIGSIVMASRATLKLDSVLEEAEDQDDVINAAKDKADTEGSTKQYTDEDAKKDKVLNRVQTAGKIAKLYAPAVGLGLVSVGCLTGSHVIINRRNAGLTAAYAALDKGFKDYRKRVVDDQGAEKDLGYRHDFEEKQIAVETDTGTDVKTVKVLNPKGKRSIYAVCFDENSRNWQKVQSMNQFFINAQQNYANDLLRARGHVFLNEVYEALGLDHTPAGSQVGWVLNYRDPETGDMVGDQYIDFRMFDDVTMGKLFMNGDEKSVWIDPNVDGVIWDKIGKKARR